MQWIKTNRSFLDLIPERSGIYMITVENTVVYVGKAKYLQTRIKQHFSDSESNMDLKNIIQHYQVSILYTEVVSESELCRIESALYYQYRPRCNQIAPPRYWYLDVIKKTGTVAPVFYIVFYLLYHFTLLDIFHPLILLDLLLTSLMPL